MRTIITYLLYKDMCKFRKLWQSLSHWKSKIGLVELVAALVNRPHSSALEPSWKMVGLLLMPAVVLTMELNQARNHSPDQGPIPSTAHYKSETLSEISDETAIHRSIFSSSYTAACHGWVPQLSGQEMYQGRHTQRA